MMWILVLWFAVTMPTVAVIVVLAFYDDGRRQLRRPGRRPLTGRRVPPRRKLVYSPPADRR
jgi:hypothetical protein